MIGQYTPTDCVQHLCKVCLINCIKVRFNLFWTYRHFQWLDLVWLPSLHIFEISSWIMNHYFPPKEPAKSTSTSLCIFPWPPIPSFLFWASHFSSHLLLLSFVCVLRLLEALWGCGWHKVVAHRERQKKNRWIEWIPWREGQKVLPVQLFQVLFFSTPSMAIIQSEPQTEPSRLTHTDWIIKVCLIFVYVKHHLTVCSCSVWRL